MLIYSLYIIFSFIVSTIFPSSSFESTLKPIWDSDFYEKKLVEERRDFCAFFYFCGSTLLLYDDKFNNFKNQYNKIKHKHTYSDDDVKQVNSLYMHLKENIETIKASIKAGYDSKQKIIDSLSTSNNRFIQEKSRLVEENSTLRKELQEKDNSGQIAVMQAQFDANLLIVNYDHKSALSSKDQRIAELEQKVLSFENNNSKKLPDNQSFNSKKELKNQSTQSSFFKKSFLWIVTIIFSIVLWEKKSVLFAKIF